MVTARTEKANKTAKGNCSFCGQASPHRYSAPSSYGTALPRGTLISGGNFHLTGIAIRIAQLAIEEQARPLCLKDTESLGHWGGKRNP